MILITPPTACEPYNVPPPPRKISMRSTFSVVSVLKSKAPSVTLLTSTPSISTRVWSDSAPRMKTDVVVPREPFCTTSRLGTLRSASATVSACCCRMSSCVMTVTAGETSVSGVSARVAVTTIGSR